MKVLMRNITAISFKNHILVLSISILLFFVVACEKDDDLSKAEILSSTRWRTTVVKDSVGNDVTSSFQNFVGLATYNKDGTYEFFTLDGTLRGIAVRLTNLK